MSGQRPASPLGGLAEALCGDDEGCLSQARELAELVEWLDTVARRLPEPRLSGVGGEPLAARVENLAEIDEAARAAVEGDEGLAEYLVRRRLYLSLRGLAAPAANARRCPVCGHLPTLIRLARVEGGLFSGYEARARCTCGMEWPFDEWLCPSCGAGGRESFDVYLAGRLEVRRCTRCGYTLTVLSGRVGQAEHALANIIASRLG